MDCLSSVEGTYWKNKINKRQKNKKVTESVAIDSCSCSRAESGGAGPSCLSWDIGSTARERAYIGSSLPRGCIEKEDDDERRAPARGPEKSRFVAAL